MQLNSLKGEQTVLHVCKPVNNIVLRLIDRTLISASKGCKYLQLLERNNNYIIQQQAGGRAAPPHS